MKFTRLTRLTAQITESLTERWIPAALDAGQKASAEVRQQLDELNRGWAEYSVPANRREKVSELSLKDKARKAQQSRKASRRKGSVKSRRKTS